MWHTSSNFNFWLELVLVKLAWVCGCDTCLRMWQEERGVSGCVRGWEGLGGLRGLGGWGRRVTICTVRRRRRGLVLRYCEAGQPQSIQWPAASTIVQTAEQWASEMNNLRDNPCPLQFEATYAWKYEATLALGCQQVQTLGWQPAHCEKKQGGA